MSVSLHPSRVSVLTMYSVKESFPQQEQMCRCLVILLKEVEYRVVISNQEESITKPALWLNPIAN